ncbi:MAG: hypothetical protein QUS11_04395 [Candidatus Fermentibacter sp.]|nr:hypothetical protein [Candidatus Fermentibacter sp.]
MARIILALAVAGLAAQASASSLAITNTTGGWDMMSVYISPFGAAGWGENRLGDSTLTEGETLSIELPTGIYSIRLIDEDGDTYTRLNSPVMGSVEWAVTLDDLDAAQAYSTGG